MEDALAKGLGVTKEQARARIVEYGGEMEAATAILALEDDLINGKRMKRDVIQHALYKCRLTPWAEKFKAQAFLKDATLYELHVTCTMNPTYPSLAARVSLEACMTLAREVLKIPVTMDAYAYALFVQEINNTKGVTKDRARQLFASNGLPWREPPMLSPFPETIFDGHALEHVDPDKTAPGKMVPARGGIGIIRERKCMRNRIVERDGVYKLNEETEAFVELICSYNRAL
jgi:hypothetical protein